MKTLIAIPARHASTRYPGKPLVPLRGPDGSKTLIRRSWEAAMAVSGIDRVVVATDDGRIRDHAAGFGAEVVMTSSEARNGTERCAEVAALLPGFDVIVNLQGDAPLILPTVDAQAVASVVQDWTGVPVGRMVKNEVEAVLRLADTLNQRVIGQKHALEMIARRVQTSRARLDNPGKPIGVFMLCGTSGVGKTETALALAESLYGGEQNVITINMSEFQEAHTVSTLKGAPPGYVGYGEGGVLTEAVRRRPYSVVLLDEVEKAHPDVFNTLLHSQIRSASSRLRHEWGCRNRLSAGASRRWKMSSGLNCSPATIGAFRSRMPGLRCWNPPAS